jgi:hypothetical protein
MTSIDQLPMVAAISEDEVERDPCLRDAYYDQKLEAIMEGRRVWIRDGFSPVEKITFSLFDKRRYIGHVTSMGDGFSVHTCEEGALTTLNTQALSLDHAQTLLVVHRQETQADNFRA